MNDGNNQPTPKFGTVNALLGGIDHAAVDPKTGAVYYVYGTIANGVDRLAIRRLTFTNGNVNIGKYDLWRSDGTTGGTSVQISGTPFANTTTA